MSGAQHNAPPFWRSRPVIAALVFSAIALFLLFSEHRAHFLYLLTTAWHVPYEAQHNRRLATTGPYAKIRHPQYVGFVVVMFGFLLQWPTLVTLVMFPVLVFMYARLAIHEEQESDARFGQTWRDYAARTQRFVPRLSRGDTVQVQ